MPFGSSVLKFQNQLFLYQRETEQGIKHASGLTFHLVFHICLNLKNKYRKV